MSIFNGPAVATTFIASSPLVDAQGVPTRTLGGPFLRALYNRGGGSDGIEPTVSSALTATGTTLATALGLKDDWNLINTVPANGGVIISPILNLQPGNDIWVYNNDAANLNVYPPSATVKIDQLGAGAPFILGAHKLRCFQCWTSTLFVSYGN